MVWRKDKNGGMHWIPNLEEQMEDDALTTIRILELIMTEKISLRGRDGEKSFEDARELDHILQDTYDVDTSDLDLAFNYYRTQLGWYQIIDIDPQSVVAKDQELKPEPEQDESKDDNHITVHDEDTDIANNELADDWMTKVMNEVMKYNREHNRNNDDHDDKNNGNE